jgi:hypothetical protein
MILVQKVADALKGLQCVLRFMLDVSRRQLLSKTLHLMGTSRPRTLGSMKEEVDNNILLFRNA